MSPHENSLILSDVAIQKKPRWDKPRVGVSALVQMFFNVNMAKMHNGMRLVAAEYDIDLDKLVPNQYVGFMNRKRTKIKLFTAGNCFAYFSLPKGTSGEIGIETIAQIPSLFGGTTKMDHDGVIEKALNAPIMVERLPLVRRETHPQEAE